MLTDRRGKALSLCSTLAIAAALAAAPQAARAQSFQGSSTVVGGSAVVNTGPNTTTVTVGSPQAVINWTPFDSATNPGIPINFQPAGTTATFQSSTQFAVLNRILPADASRPVQFNGNVISQIQNTAGSVPGGTVYFYSPGGIIVGATAAFNVGNLGLTTSDPVVIGGNFIGTSGRGTPQVAFTGANAGGRVEIQSGAQINALNAGSYVAAFARSIVQNGTVTVNGQAAYVAGEAGTITFNPDGLYDIQVTTGTDGESGGFAIGHNGTTTGSASTGAGDNRRIYLVAVPKNQLITLAIGRGSLLGFDIAGAANVSGNAVVLSAGHNIGAGTIDAAPAGGATGAANLSINDSNTAQAGAGMAFTSAVTAQASRHLNVTVFRQTSFASNVSLTGLGLAQVTVSALSPQALGQLTVNGNLTISAESQLPVPGATTDVGNAFLTLLNGGSASVSGNVAIQANAYAFTTVDGATTGGTAQLQLNGASSLGIGGNLTLRAQGITSGAATAMSATGGNAQIVMNGASSAAVGGVTRVRSDGVGRGANVTGGFSGLTVQQGSSFTTSQLNVSADASGTEGGPTATAGLATGGNAQINVSGANSALTVQTGNSVGDPNIGELDLLSAEAFAGRTNAAGGTGGNAQGGNASLNVNAGAVANLPVNPGTFGGVRMLARAYGGNVVGNGGTGGTATGGIVSLNINGATLNSGNLLLPSSFAQGGSVGTTGTGTINGGHAFGGQRNVSIVNGTLNGSFAGGGPGGQGGNGSQTGTGGNGTGGTANFLMDNATINATTDAFGIARVIAFTQNAGGLGMIGGNTSGGVVNVTIRNNSVINANGAGSTVNFNSLNQNLAAATPGAIATGDAAAGTVNVSILNSVINAAQFDIYAHAVSGGIATVSGAGANARTGNAVGGLARLFLNGATITAGTVSVGANALAGGSTDINAVNGGNATGGTAQILAQGSANTINASGGVTVEASGVGGAISGPGNGGNGTGGFAFVSASNGATMTINGDTGLFADGTGQSASVQGRGGDGISGFSEVAGINGSLTFNGDLEVHANANGGDGPTAGLARATLQLDRPNALVRAQNGSVTVNGAITALAESHGGAGLIGGAGGNAVGGFAVVDAQNNLAGPSTITSNGLVIDSSAYGGAGGDALSGQPGGAGGNAFAGLSQAFGNAGNGRLIVNGISFINAIGFGGEGGLGGPGASGAAGGAGGNATGGDIQFGTRSGLDTGTINTGSAQFGAVQAVANAFGGTGGAGGSGTTQGIGGAGGDASGGGATLLVRGSPVTITSGATLSGDATGGAGGAGSTPGAGGDATVGNGGTGILATSRFEQPTQRGRLQAQNILVTAQAIGGAGSVAGTGRVADAPLQFQVDRADVTLNSLVMLASGERVAGVGPSTLSIANGVVDVADTLSLSTPGDLSISLDTATVNVANLSLSAGNFVLPAVRPATLGTFNVSQNLEIHSGLDFRAYANFDVARDGFFDIDGSVLTGDLAFDGNFDLLAGGSVTTGAILAGGFIEVEAGGPVALGNLTGGQQVSVETRGTLSVGNVVAGPDATTQFSIGLVAGGDLTAGDLTGSGSIGLLSNTGSISVGTVVATRSLLALARGAASFGGITTGTTANDFAYIANSSMISLGGALDDNFNPAPIFAAPPVALTGPITITGSVSTGNLIAATIGALSIGAGTTLATINLPGRLNLVVGGPLALGNVTAADIRLQSSSTVTSGALTSRAGVTVLGAGAVTLGNLSAGIANPTTSDVAREVRVASTGGAVTVGTVASAGDVRIDAVGGSLTAGAITAGDDVLLLARDSVAVGGITAGTADGRITIANSALRSLGDVNDADPDAIFDAIPIAVTGSITIGGPVTGTIFRAAGTGDFTAGTMTLGQSLRVDRAALLQVNGAWVAPTINLASQRIAFGTASGAGIGGSGTTSLTLRALTSGQTAVLGGTTAGSGYTLTQADFGRIRSTNLTLQVDSQGVSSTSPDLDIRDLTLNGSAGSGFASTIITTSGRARVTGDLLLTQAGTTDTLAVNATSRLEIVLPEGSIAIAGAGGALAGTLTLSSNNLVAGTVDILQQVMADPEAAGLAVALKTPASTTANLEGYIRAEGVRLLSNANILLQNSGTARDFAGVTVGGGGLIIGRITPASGGTGGDTPPTGPSGPLNVIGFGRQIGAGGQVISNNGFFPTVHFGTTGENPIEFSAISQFNACIVGGACLGPSLEDLAPVDSIASAISVVTGATLDDSPSAPAADDADEGDDGSSEEAEEEDDSDPGSSAITPPAPLINTRRLNPNVDVVEPVSGGGNPALLGSAVQEDTVQGDNP